MAAGLKKEGSFAARRTVGSHGSFEPERPYTVHLTSDQVVWCLKCSQLAARTSLYRPEKFSSRESYLYHSQVEHFREAFNLFDTDGGGSIDIDELGACLRSLGKVRHRQDNLGRSD